MFRRYRQRRGPYALARPSVVPSFVRSLILLLVAGFVLYLIGRGILTLFGLGSGGDRAPVSLTIERGGAVNVSLEGGLMQRADDSMKLYATDKISTATTGHARLSFFDKSWIRLDGNTDLSLEKSEIGVEESVITATLTKGAVWIDTPSEDIYSGSIIRTIHTPSFTLHIPADTRAAIDEKTVLVFSAEGNGIGVTLKGSKEEQFIGEGQQMSLPDSPGTDALDYRTAIDPLAAQKMFVVESRAMQHAGTTVTAGSGTALQIDPNSIVLKTPADNAAVSTATVTIAGAAGANIARIRINGHEVSINRTDMSFSKEIALSEAATTDIRIEALDSNDIVLDQISRTIRRTIQTIVPPTITSPAKNGQTFRTQDLQIEIRGTVPAGAAGIIVNDYKLQLFRTGDTTWSYLASRQLNNLLDGRNVFNVYAVDAAGNPSAPATITILVEAGVAGIVSTGSTIGGSSPTAQVQIDEATLPQNTPLTPGVISVTGPTAGASHTATGSEILIEGTTSAQTASVWVNGYKLQLYKAGITRWNYIARTDYGTLKRGTNVYKINVRDANNQILDSFTYTVQYNP